MLMGLVFPGALVFFAFWMYRLQILQGTEWDAIAQEQRARMVRLPATRGIIYSRSGEPLVRNVPAFQVAVVPGLLPEDEAEQTVVLQRLADLIHVPFEDIQSEVAEALIRAPYEPLVVAPQVERQLALIVSQEGMRLPGVWVDVTSRREYPYGSLVAQLVGYLGAIPQEEEQSYRQQGYDPAVDRVGYSGMELQLEHILRGEAGQQYQEEDVLGRVVRILGDVQAPVAGQNVYLTLDLQLQQVVQDALWRGMTRPSVNSRRGVAIVMDTRTGEVLSMVSLPTYDNNLFAQGISLEDWQALIDDPHRPLVNHAIADQLPPGSIFKIVPAAAALQEGVLTEETRLECPGTIELPNRYYPNDPGRAQPFYCWLRSGHGWLNIVDGLAHSCDIFFYQVGGGLEEADFEGLGLELMAEYAELFGLGNLTGIELPHEQPGLVPTATWKRREIGENWSTGDTYILTIGQGYLLATPLQMLNVMATTANRGVMYRPQIVHHVTDADGNVAQPFQPEISRTLTISPENWVLIHQGLEGAVVYGTATSGQIEQVRVAGKTGTAQFCDDLAQQLGICGEGLAQPTHAWYMAFAPIEEPEVAVVVFVYNGGEGSAVAVPIGQEILQWYFYGRAP
jgi:penicillin-binding protein 2